MTTSTLTPSLTARHLTSSCLTLGLLAFMPAMAGAAETSAPNNANCEIVLTNPIQDENGKARGLGATYFPANDFLISVYEEGTPTMTEFKDRPISAVICKRLDVIPTKNDYSIVATGIPFSLSQSFDSRDSDLVTIYYKDGSFQKIYKGPGLSEEASTLLDKRLAAYDKMKAGETK